MRNSFKACEYYQLTLSVPRTTFFPLYEDGIQVCGVVLENRLIRHVCGAVILLK